MDWERKINREIMEENVMESARHLWFGRSIMIVPANIKPKLEECLQNNVDVWSGQVHIQISVQFKIYGCPLMISMQPDWASCHMCKSDRDTFIQTLYRSICLSVRPFYLLFCLSVFLSVYSVAWKFCQTSIKPFIYCLCMTADSFYNLRSLYFYASFSDNRPSHN